LESGNKINITHLNFMFPVDGGDLIEGGSRRNSLRLQESQPKSLAIEVLSSQSKVSVSIDGTTVSRLTGNAVLL
jgi:hypothetical protein